MNLASEIVKLKKYILNYETMIQTGITNLAVSVMLKTPKYFEVILNIFKISSE